MNKYRVLMEDAVDGKKFNFAIEVEGVNQHSAETRQRFGYTEDDGARWNAGAKAIEEFPDATLVEIRLIEPSLKELLQKALEQTKGVYIHDLAA